MTTIVEQFKQKLSEHSGIQLELIINENRSTMLNILARKRNWVKVSMHRMFLDAPEDVISALVHYVKGTRQYRPKVIHCYIQNKLPQLDYSHHLDPAKLSTVGKVYNLQHIYDHINREYFNGELNLKITWYGCANKRGRSKITFGQYHESLKLVKIHRILDDVAFPDYFVAFVVYHEILHYLIPTFVDEKGRYCSHGKEFKMYERQFKEYDQARNWEKQHRTTFFLD